MKIKINPKISLNETLKSKKQILSVISTVVISVFLVVGAVFAVTTISANIATDGNLTVSGNTTLGDANTDTITANSSITITGGTVTADAPVISATQTWNAGAVTFNGIKLNVTDTASAAGSLLADLQVGGVSKFSVSKAGAVTAGTYNGNTITTGTGTLTLGAGKTLTVSGSTTLADNVITFGGTETLTLTAAKNVAFADAFSTSGAFPVILTSTASTNVTLPTTGTLATLAGTETLTNKTLTSPTLTTPALGVATATSMNKVTITAPATGSTLTIADGKTLTANNTLILAGTDATTMTFPGASDTVVGLAATQTLTNKTLTSPTLTTPALGVATATSVAIGGGTAITKIVVYSASLTPVATAAAIGTTQQTFTVTGLATTDKIIVNGPVPTSLCPMTGYRVSLADTLQLDFTTLTAVACTPAAGTYNIVAIRN